MNIYRALLRRYRPEAFEIARRALLAGSASIFAAAAARAAAVGPIRPPNGKRVVVIGAGFAGLAAAYEAIRSGFEVRLFEARSRVGGRVRTFRPFEWIPGKYMEGGAELIGSNHFNWVRYAKEFDLTFRDMTSWPDGSEHIVVDGKPIDDETKEIVFAILDLLYSALTDEARDNVSDAPWTSPRAKEQDAISLRQWLESVTVPSAFATLLAKTDVPRAEKDTIAKAMRRTSDWAAALALAKRAFATQLGADNGVEIEQQSLLGLATVIKAHGLAAFWTDTEIWRCTQGNDALAHAFHREIGPDRFALGTPATRLIERSDGVELTAGGTTHKADFAVLAVPPTLWDRIGIEPALPIAKPQMGVNTKFLARLKAPVWDDRNPEVLSTGIVSEIWHATDKQPAGGDIGMVGFAGGTAAAEGLKAYAASGDRSFVAEFERVFPEFRGKYVEHRYMDWPNQEWTKGGYTAAPPGYIVANGEKLYAGTPRIKLAGEHCSFGFEGFMEGALESGVRAARALSAAIDSGQKPQARVRRGS